MFEYFFKAVLIKERRKVVFIFVINCRDITSISNHYIALAVQHDFYPLHMHA